MGAKFKCEKGGKQRLTHEISRHRQRSDAQASEGGGGRDVSVELVDHRLLTVASHDHLLLLQLLGDLKSTNISIHFPKKAKIHLKKLIEEEKKENVHPWR